MLVPEPPVKAAWLSGEMAVVGLARSGRTVATLLARTGANVYASDAGDTAQLRHTAQTLVEEGVDVEVGAHDLERIRLASVMVVSPGVPPDAAPVALARECGIEIVSEVEVALRFLPELRYIAVTGTNGKTTTTALAGHLMQSLGLRARTGGNIGTPLSELALSAAPPAWVALELSSFQLHDTPSVEPAAGILTNLSANHLDRYDGVESYYADKALMFRNATPASVWVSNADEADVQAMVDGVPGLHARFSTRESADAWYDRDADALVVLGFPVVPRSEFHLLGDHNVANALAATLAVMLADPSHRTPDAVQALGEGLRTFRALEHRIETVADVGGVTWINDSKSTNVASTLVALRGMTRPTVLLLGGKHKGEPYTALNDELRRTVKLVIAYGEAAPLVARDVADVVPIRQLGSNFAEVIQAARAAAHAGDVVVLSPACSSYDMFDNYEHRGAEFKRLVEHPEAS